MRSLTGVYHLVKMFDLPSVQVVVLPIAKLIPMVYTNKKAGGFMDNEIFGSLLL